MHRNNAGNSAIPTLFRPIPPYSVPDWPHYICSLGAWTAAAGRTSCVLKGRAKTRCLGWEGWKGLSGPI